MKLLRLLDRHLTFAGLQKSGPRVETVTACAARRGRDDFCWCRRDRTQRRRSKVSPIEPRNDDLAKRERMRAAFILRRQEEQEGEPGRRSDWEESGRFLGF